jgi:hypothetical protein
MRRKWPPISPSLPKCTSPPKSCIKKLGEFAVVIFDAYQEQQNLAIQLWQDQFVDAIPAVKLY